MASITIFLDKCTGCTLCVKACPFGAIHMANKKAVIDMAKCTLCGACVEVCKFAAIEIKKDGGPKKDLSAYKDVWVFCEQTHPSQGMGDLRAENLDPVENVR